MKTSNDSDQPEFSKVYDQIRSGQRGLFLNRLLIEYVDRQGLGAMPKSYFDALLVHLFLDYSTKRFDSFELSRLFKIRESRLKTLIASAGVKFERRSEQEIWMEILEKWKDSLKEIESAEYGGRV